MIRKIFSSKLVKIGLGILVALGLIVPSVYSSGPQFNYLPDDLEMLVARNYTQDGKWMDPASANVGEVVSFQLYYHNGVENTVAKNTQIRADLPGVASDRLVVNGYLWANNADIVADTATINTDQLALLEYLPGTTKWFPNRSTVGQSLPDGITSDDGISISNIKGCWDYAGFVTFRARLIGPPTAKLVKSKSAYNITKGANAESVVAKPGDRIRYSLKVANTGNASDSIVISDNISDVLKYANMVNLGGGSLNGSTISWPKVTVKAGTSVTKNFVVQIKEAIPANRIVYLDNTYGNRVKVPAKREVDINPGLEIVKTVRNITKGETGFVNQNSAKPGNVLEYRLKVINEGDIDLTNLKVVDILPSQVRYINGSAKMGYGPNNVNTPISDSLVSGGVNLGKLVSADNDQGLYQWLRIDLKAKVKPNLTVGKYQLLNKARTVADYTSEIASGTLSDSASALTLVGVKAQPNFIVTKKVKNISNPTNYLNEVGARPGERVMYKIVVENTSQAKLDDLSIIDALPANVKFDWDSVRAKLNGNSVDLSAKMVNNYQDLPTLNTGDRLIVTFKALTDKNLASNSKLVNTVIVRGSGLKRSAQATVVIHTPRVKAVEGPMPATGTSYNFLAGIFGLVGMAYSIYKIGL